jgi:hypothetical protein
LIDHVDGVRRCLSELRPPTGLLFFPQVIYEHGEQWWNYIHRRKLIPPTELSGNPTSRIISSKQEEQTKEMMNLALRSIFVHSFQVIFACRKFYDMGLTALLPLRRCDADFYRP